MLEPPTLRGPLEDGSSHFRGGPGQNPSANAYVPLTRSSLRADQSIPAPADRLSRRTSAGPSMNSASPSISRASSCCALLCGFAIGLRSMTLEMRDGAVAACSFRLAAVGSGHLSLALAAPGPRMEASHSFPCSTRRRRAKLFTGTRKARRAAGWIRRRYEAASVPMALKHQAPTVGAGRPRPAGRDQVGVQGQAGACCRTPKVGNRSGS
jgi:hypothetical protein